MKVLHSTKMSLYSASIVTSVIFALILGGFQVVQAETDIRPTGVPPLPPKPALRKEAAEVRKEIRNDAQEVRKDIRQTATSTRRNIIQTGKSKAEDIREDLKANRASTTKALRENRASTTAAIRANREELRGEIKEKRDELKKKLETFKKEKKQKLDDKKKGVVNTALKNIFARFSERIAQLTNINSRLRAKITELQAKGTDVASTVTLLTSAKTALEKAEVDVEATKTLASEQTATSTSKEILKSLVNTADESIKSAKDSYKKVGESLRPFLGGDISASSTVSN